MRQMWTPEVPGKIPWHDFGWGEAGSAAAFMLTGPATKITNLEALKIILGFRHFLLYMAYVLLFSLAAGAAVNLWVMR